MRVCYKERLPNNENTVLSKFVNLRRKVILAGNFVCHGLCELGNKLQHSRSSWQYEKSEDWPMLTFCFARASIKVNVAETKRNKRKIAP